MYHTNHNGNGRAQATVYRPSKPRRGAPRHPIRPDIDELLNRAVESDRRIRDARDRYFAYERFKRELNSLCGDTAPDLTRSHFLFGVAVNQYCAGVKL